MAKKLLNGLELAGFIKERQAKAVRGLRQAEGIAPKLAIIQTKDDPVIDTYVRLKKAYGNDILVDVDVHRIDQAEAEQMINKLNDDETVHGIIVQLPLSDVSKTEEICNLVSPSKDVDALGDPDAPWPAHLDAMQGENEQRTETYGKYDEGVAEVSTTQSTKTVSRVAGSARKQANGVRGSWFEPATPMAILWLLAGYNVDLKSKNILLVGRGKLVGAPLEKILKSGGHNVTLADRGTKELNKLSIDSDIIITATGSPSIISSDMIKQGAVVVDAGVASESGKTVGDLADDVYQRDDLTITPTKGGVGPLTVCALFENVILTARRRAD